MDGARYRDRWQTQSEIVFRRHTEGRGTRFGEEETKKCIKSTLVRRGRLDPIEEEIIRAGKGRKPNKTEPEWPELLRIPLAELPEYEPSCSHRAVQAATHQSSSSHRVKDQAHELQSGSRHWAKQRAAEKKKWNKWYASLQEKKKKTKQRQCTKVHHGWKEMERKGEEKRKKKRRRRPQSRKRTRIKKKRVGPASARSQTGHLQHFRSEHLGRKKAAEKKITQRRNAYRD